MYRANILFIKNIYKKPLPFFNVIQILHILNFHNGADIFGETFILDNKNIIVFPLMPLAEKITFVHAIFQ